MATIEIGKPLPEFIAESTQGEFNSTKLKGKISVIYFYPRDNTPGCTTEAQGFRDNYAKFQKLGCEIYGISRDTMKSHERFAEKQSLPFALIADPEETVCNLFGVMKDKTMFGKPVRGIVRSTFLLDTNGNLVQEWRNVKVPGHVEEVLAAVKDIANN